MNMGAFLGLVVMASIAGWLIAQEQPSSNTVHAASPSQPPHIVMSPESITWNAAGNGTEFAVLSGSPATEGESFVIRLRFADQTHVPPHPHPLAKQITIIARPFSISTAD